MAETRSSRELASRIEIEFQKHPNRFRRATWCTALAAAIAAAAWLSVEAKRGERRIYEAGPITTPHQMFENDCSKCHVTWSPLTRLVTLKDEVASVDSQKCEACHAGSLHHGNQIPVHGNDALSCGLCHREHEGDKSLAWIEDRHCLRCHTDLKVKVEDQPGDTHVEASKTFARSIHSFDDDHPEFALTRSVVSARSSQLDIAEGHNVYSVLEYFQRERETETKWQDRGRIRFNHKKHLKRKQKKDGRVVDGLLDENGEFIELKCNDCHVPDADRQYMRPIHYDQHCARCHPLHFDVDDPQQTVPHRSLEVVRGYLTDYYTLRTQERAAANPEQPSHRKIPGRYIRYRNTLAEEQVGQINQQIQQAEQRALQHTHALLERSGGCRYCHEVQQSDEGVVTKINPPNIPDRWMKHSRFRHESHRMLGCESCHGRVSASESTGDVLMPSRDICLNCHVRDFQKNADRSVAMHYRGARTDCVECHTYHDNSKENFDGPETLETFLSGTASESN